MTYMEPRPVMEEVNVSPKSPGLFDPHDLFAIAFRRRWPFFVTFAITLLLAIAVTLSLPKIYRASSRLLLEPREAQPVKVNDRGIVAPADDNLIDTAVQIIRSPSLMADVARQLNLARNGSTGDEASLSLEARWRAAADRLMANTSARRIGVTYLVEISATSENAGEAAAIANAVAERYIQLSTAQKQMRNLDSARFVESQADALRKQAVADDAALQSYMVRNNLMSAQGATMAEQEVSELNRQIAEAQAQLAEQRGKLRAAQTQIARGGGGADIGSALASETIRQLRQQEAQASAALAQVDARYGDRHPAVVQAKEELDDVRRQLQAELARILSGLRGDVEIAASRLNSLTGSRAKAQGTLAQNSSAQVGRLELERKADASRAIYNAYLTRAKETAQAGELPNADATVASVAKIPRTHSSPMYSLCAIAALLGALTAGLVAIIAAEYFDRTVKGRKDIEGITGAIFAGAIPQLEPVMGLAGIKNEPYDYVLSKPMSLFTESIRNLAAHLGLASVGGPAKVITVTSAVPGEGKTTIAVCLARTLALANYRVILVDADVRRHSASRALSPALEANSLFHVLSGSQSVEEAISVDQESGLHTLLTLGLGQSNDILSEKNLHNLVKTLRKNYEVIIFDSAPVLGIADTRILSQLSDIVLSLVKWRDTNIKAARATMALLQDAGAKRICFALNHVKIDEYSQACDTDAISYYKKFNHYYVN